ncbi:MAG: ion transporter [bacterium]|nr:ion transporter [bacterium]
MRKRLYEIVEVAHESDHLSYAYDLLMMVVIVVSLIPLAFKEHLPLFHYTDVFTTIVFILDYLLRWMTADYRFEKRSWWSFAKYPFTMWAIIDLLSILPTLTVLNSSLKLFRCLRMFQAFRVLRVFKAFRYSRSFFIVVKVIKNSSEPLQAVCTLAIGYILLSALVVFNVEGDTFKTFFDAVYWATVSLTTVGYGDIYPVTMAGRIITMFSSFFGIAVVALPAGIITAGYMDAINDLKKEHE